MKTYGPDGKPFKKPVKADLTRTFSVALHEAAHAVTAEFLGVRVRRVCLESATTGHCQYDGRSFPWKRDRFICALGVARYYVGKGQRLEAARDVAWSIVKGRESEVRRVARALLKHDLSGVEVRRISCAVRN